MNTCNQSHEIIEMGRDFVPQIGLAAGTCYQTDLGDNPGKLVNGIVKKKHNSCLEAAVLHLYIECQDYTALLPLLESNFIIVAYDHSDGLSEELYCTASVRSWREFVQKDHDDYDTTLVRLVRDFLCDNLDSVLTNDLPDVPKVEGECGADFQIAEFKPDMLLSTGIWSKKDYMKHKHIMVKFTTNRAVSHELVRHRFCGILQESQRFCAYVKKKFGGQVMFVEPTAFFEMDSEAYGLWLEAMKVTERIYLDILSIVDPATGKPKYTAQAARTVLPNSCKTSIVVFTSLKQWLHVFAMRSDKGTVEPSMLELMLPLWEDFKVMFPGMFDELERSVG